MGILCLLLSLRNSCSGEVGRDCLLGLCLWKQHLAYMASGTRKWGAGMQRWVLELRKWETETQNNVLHPTLQQTAFPTKSKLHWKDDQRKAWRCVPQILALWKEWREYHEFGSTLAYIAKTLPQQMIYDIYTYMYTYIHTHIYIICNIYYVQYGYPSSRGTGAGAHTDGQHQGTDYIQLSPTLENTLNSNFKLLFWLIVYHFYIIAKVKKYKTSHMDTEEMASW